MPPIKKDPIPVQQEGRQSDIIENSAFTTPELADKAFQLARQRLYDINNWGNITEGISADFMLTDKQGNRLGRKPEKGDYIRIDLPGPGSIAGHGYDRLKTRDHRKVPLIFSTPPLPVHFYLSKRITSFLRLCMEEMKRLLLLKKLCKAIIGK
jgi:hypothetical protein